MRITGVHHYLYNLPLLISPPGLATDIKSRHGLIIGLVSDDGAIGWGDIAPLEGFSHETLDEAVDALYTCSLVLQKFEFFETKSLFHDSFQKAIGHISLCSSLRFGLETALLNLIEEQNGVPWYRTLTGTYCDTISVNALVNSDHLEDEVCDYVKRGYRHIKVKVGGKTPRQAAEIVWNILDMYGEQVILRLDANSKWPLDVANQFSELVYEYPIEYIEEPVDKIEDIPSFIRKSPIPVALDESLGKLDDIVEGVYALILKPMLRGGISGVLNWVGKAQSIGVIPVISSTFESGVGMRAIIQLSAAMGNSEIPVGLDTYRYLDDDVLDPRLDINHPILNVDEVLSNCLCIYDKGRKDGV